MSNGYFCSPGQIDKTSWNSGKLLPLGGGMVYRWVSELRIISCGFDLTVKLSEKTQNPHPEVSSPEKPRTATADSSASPVCELLSGMLTPHSLQGWDLRQMWVRKNRSLQGLVVFTGRIVSVETLPVWPLSDRIPWQKQDGSEIPTPGTSVRPGPYSSLYKHRKHRFESSPCQK